MRPISLFAAAAIATAAARADAPPRVPDGSPTPPRQAEAWTPPPSALPAAMNASAAELFALGLADPRGCDYRRIRIEVGHVWGGGGEEVETSGWALPAAEPGGEPRFAIAWSGVIYPLVKLLGPADLDADVRSMVGRFQDLRANNETAATAVAAARPIRACLLLRLGRADLAETVWDRGVGRGEPGADPRAIADQAAFLPLASDLAWDHFDRAICAHMRGDDGVALAEVRFLSPFSAAVDAKAGKLGLPRPRRSDGGPAPSIEFLGQLPEFLADQERRAREREGPAGGPPAGRVEGLIRSLDQVAVRQWGQPGGVNLGESPIVQALVQAGDEAVDPLLRDFRSEGRLTRSVSFHRDFHRDRTIHRADEAAYAALLGILKVSTFGGRRPDGRPPSRQEVADEVEAYWRKNRGLPPVERWYRTLADDAAGAPAWLDAAGLITRPGNVRVIPGGGPFALMETAQPPPGVRPPLQGEPLRDGREPSVSALMLRRAEALLEDRKGQPLEQSPGRRMASSLAAWDPLAALPLLRELSREARKQAAAADPQQPWKGQQLAAVVAEFTEARVRADDPEALPEYASWLRSASPGHVGHHVEAALGPLIRHHAHPALAEAAARLFGDPASPWLPIVGRATGSDDMDAQRLVQSSLVDVPAFRDALLAGLKDRTPIGKARMEAGGIRLELDSGMSSSSSAIQADPAPPAPGVERPLRRCDYLAWLLGTRRGGTPFNPCWDDARRDKALEAAAEHLRRRAGLAVGRVGRPPRAAG